jgi:hypothetical protein
VAGAAGGRAMEAKRNHGRVGWLAITKMIDTKSGSKRN